VVLLLPPPPPHAQGSIIKLCETKLTHKLCLKVRAIVAMLVVVMEKK